MTTTITPSTGQNVGILQLGPGQVGYGAIDWRRQIAAGPLQEGVFESGAWKVTAGGALNVSIAASTGTGALVKGDNITSQGLYYVAPHSAAIVEAHTAAHATLPRIDQIVLEVLDATHDGGASNTVRTRIVDGTATAGATLDNRNGVAALPNNAVRLADVLIPAAGVTVIAGNIRDRRPWARGAYHVLTRNTADYSISSATLAEIDATNLKPRIECSGMPLRISLTGTMTNNGAAVTTAVMVPLIDSASVDGMAIAGASGATATTGYRMTLHAGAYGARAPLDHPTTPAAGSHLISVAWASDSAVALLLRASATQPLSLIIAETVRPNASNT